MKTRIIGLLFLALVIVGAIWYKTTTTAGMVTLRGYAGGEKMGLLTDPDAVRILSGKYKIKLDAQKVGSIEMVQGITTNQDFLFPSSQIALEMYKSRTDATLAKAETVLTTPIVLYSWDIVTDALVKQGVVEQVDSVWYVNDMAKLLDIIAKDTKWSDIGLTDLYGKMAINTTDPAKSNSGALFAALAANVLNHGDVVDEQTLPAVQTELNQLFLKLGYMETSSSDLFDQYLRTGVGAKPLVAGYENQIIEFAAINPEDYAQVKDKIRILYPKPTVWSAHPFMALNAKSVPAIQGLMDPKVQEIAWQKHGFRIGTAGTIQKIPLMQELHIPENITSVMPLPGYAVMNRMIAALAQNH